MSLTLDQLKLEMDTLLASPTFAFSMSDLISLVDRVNQAACSWCVWVLVDLLKLVDGKEHLPYERDSLWNSWTERYLLALKIPSHPLVIYEFIENGSKRLQWKVLWIRIPSFRKSPFAIWRWMNRQRQSLVKHPKMVRLRHPNWNPWVKVHWRSLVGPTIEWFFPLYLFLRLSGNVPLSQGLTIYGSPASPRTPVLQSE